MVGLDPLNSERRGKRKAGSVVTCDYNGWTDAPEEEREWFDQHPEIWNGTFRPIEVRTKHEDTADRGTTRSR